MKYIYIFFDFLILLLMFIVITKVYRWLANYVGAKLGIDKLIKYLYRKIRDKERC